MLLCVCVFGVVFLSVCIFKLVCLCVYSCTWVAVCFARVRCVCVGDFACWCVFVGQLYVCVFLCMCFCTLHMLLISLMAFVYLMLFKSLMSVMPLM